MTVIINPGTMRVLENIGRQIKPNWTEPLKQQGSLLVFSDLLLRDSLQVMIMDSER